MEAENKTQRETTGSQICTETRLLAPWTLGLRRREGGRKRQALGSARHSQARL